MNNEQLRSLLKSKYNKYLFQARGLPLGVRVPTLRQIEISKTEVLVFRIIRFITMKALLYAFVLGYMKAPMSVKIPYINFFLPHINDWAVCDGLVSTLKIKKE